jgi:Methyltransferase domain
VLNWAVRYYPIVRILESEGLLKKGSLLEIGSGPIGIGLFRKVPFIGCDLSFAFEPKPPMFPMKASATELPFSDHIFDVVLSSDVLEHVPPASRTKVVTEALRVSKRLAIFAFPCGEAAWELDRELREAYRKSKLDVPEWLEEHTLAPFPGSDIFTGITGWSIEQIGNDNLQFHARLARKEMSRAFCLASLASMRLAPRIVEFTLKKADRSPYYRQIFVLRKQSNTAESSTPTNEKP